jgi:hypothetical protein
VLDDECSESLFVAEQVVEGDGLCGLHAPKGTTHP